MKMQLVHSLVYNALLLTPALGLALEQRSILSANSTTVANYTTGACNNSPLLCNKAYNTITHLGAHDAPFLRDAATSNTVAGDQSYNATVALDAGVRLLETQIQEVTAGDGVPWLCHTSCDILNAGSLEPWLAAVRHWLETHPSEVITILIANEPNLPATAFTAAFEGSGIAQYAYAHNASTSPASWPTLAELVAANTRLVAFLSGEANTTAVPYLLDEFTYIFETPFSVTSATEFNCTIDRPAGVPLATALSDGKMPFMNHFLYDDVGFGIVIPNASYVAITNSDNDTSAVGNLGTATRNCEAAWGRVPSFVLVDFFDQGPAIDAVDKLNNVTTVYNRISPSAAAATLANKTSADAKLSVKAKLASLAGEQKSGTVIKPGQWILAGGTWTDVTSGFTFED